jgi:hypothetical protein
MTSQGNGRPDPFQVRMSQHTREVLKQRQREASEAGVGDHSKSFRKNLWSPTKTRCTSLNPLYLFLSATPPIEVSVGEKWSSFPNLLQ